MLLAQGAVARRVDERNSARHAVHNHVVEAPDTRAKGKKHQKPVPEGDFFHKKPQKRSILQQGIYKVQLNISLFPFKKINLISKDAPGRRPVVTCLKRILYANKNLVSDYFWNSVPHRAVRLLQGIVHRGERPAEKQPFHRFRVHASVRKPRGVRRLHLDTRSAGRLHLRHHYRDRGRLHLLHGVPAALRREDLPLRVDSREDRRKDPQEGRKRQEGIRRYRHHQRQHDRAVQSTATTPSIRQASTAARCTSASSTRLPYSTFRATPSRRATRRRLRSAFSHWTPAVP